MSTIIVNGTRLRVGDRLTKAGLAAEAHFDSVVNAYLESVDAVPTGHPYGYQWRLETRAGALLIVSRGHMVMQRFEDVDQAADLIGHRHELNRYSGKWNFHYDLGAAEQEVDHWKRQLASVLNRCSKGWLLPIRTTKGRAP